LERIALRLTSALLVLFFSALNSFPQSSASSNASPTQAALGCKVESLPEGVQNNLKTKFQQWRIQEPSDLTQTARERWAGEKSLRCPGIASGEFENEKSTFYAVLLVPRTRSIMGYRFIVFGPNDGTAGHGAQIVDKSNDTAPGNLFIRNVAIGKFFSSTSKRKFHVLAREGILMADSGADEYEVDIYFWTGSKFDHSPIDY
jgi:hypothetical protein